jgi:cytochrome c oxidase subunit 4
MNDAHTMSDTETSPSLATYGIIYASLLALMAATIIAAYLPLGVFNVPVALVIAFTKTVLVALFFMHVRYSGKLIWVVAAGALVWLAILLSIYHDYLTRDWTPNRVAVLTSFPGSVSQCTVGQAPPAEPLGFIDLRSS